MKYRSGCTMEESKVVRRYFQRVECPHCNYRFKTKQRAVWITCHKCNRRFKRLKNIVGKKQKENY